VYPHEIIYIAIEDRKSVLYLTDRKIETHYSMEHWKAVLDEKSFAQPHYSYIINLHYVEEVTKDFVILRHSDNEYKVYTSMRKIGAFKKAVWSLITMPNEAKTNVFVENTNIFT
jgi:DNA-binding LytR/AlgR family response regulator